MSHIELLDVDKYYKDVTISNKTKNIFNYFFKYLASKVNKNYVMFKEITYCDIVLWWMVVQLLYAFQLE